VVLNLEIRKQPWSPHGCWKSGRAESRVKPIVASPDVAAATAGRRSRLLPQ